MVHSIAVNLRPQGARARASTSAIAGINNRTLTALLTSSPRQTACCCGPSTVSINAIAKRARTGKDTIYRRWPCKEDLLLDALASQQQAVDIRRRPGPRRARRRSHLPDRAFFTTNATAAFCGASTERVTSSRSSAVATSRRCSRNAGKVRALVRAGIARGELASHGNPTQAALMPVAAVVMSALEDTPIPGNPRRAAATMVDSVLHGLAASPDVTGNQ